MGIVSSFAKRSLLLAAGFWILAGGIAQAATPDCGDILTTDTVFDSDLNCDETAVLLRGPGSNNVTVDCTGFSINVTDGDGINAGSDVTGVTIRNCTIDVTGTFARGILFSSGASDCLITENTITASGPSSRALNLRMGADNNEITGNTLNSVDGSNALRIRFADNNIATDNTIEAGNAYAVNIQSAEGNEISGNTLISPEGWVYQAKFNLQNGGLSVDSAGNIYGVDNDWGSSAGLGTSTGFFRMDPDTGVAQDVVRLQTGATDIGFGCQMATFWRSRVMRAIRTSSTKSTRIPVRSPHPCWFS